MELDSTLLLAVFLGMLLLLIVLGLGIALARALVPKLPPGAPLVASEDGHYDVAGKRISCSHCGSEKFNQNQVLLNTWLFSLLRVDWLDDSATVLTCQRCGKLSWFSQDSSDDGD